MQPLPSSSRVAIADAAAATGRVEPACLDPLEGGKPLDAAKLTDVDKSAAPETDKALARARVYFEAERWVDAAKASRAVAFEQPDTSAGVFAAQLYLQCLNQIGAHGRRAPCYDDVLPRDMSALHDLYCGARRSANRGACGELDLVDVDVRRLVAQRLVERADQGDTTLYRKAAEKYAEIVRSSCTPPASSAMRCDEIAYNAAAAYLAAGDDASARAIRALMLDPKNKMEKSPLVQKLACRLDGAGC
jgi:hypothetical protein